MAKDLLDLTEETSPSLDDQLYLVTNSGTVDKRVTTANVDWFARKLR